MNSWQGDGIISRATTPRLLDAISDTGVPFVELTDRKGDVEFSQIHSDDAAVGRMGGEYLLERGFERFGFCGYNGEAWSKRREDTFVRTVDEKSSGECSPYNSAWQGRAARN